MMHAYTVPIEGLMLLSKVRLCRQSVNLIRMAIRVWKIALLHFANALNNANRWWQKFHHHGFPYSSTWSDFLKNIDVLTNLSNSFHVHMYHHHHHRRLFITMPRPQGSAWDADTEKWKKTVSKWKHEDVSSRGAMLSICQQCKNNKNKNWAFWVVFFCF